jgi:hypothetical protein
MNVQVEVFSAVVHLHIHTEIEAATAVWRAPDDGHCNVRNLLNSVCTTKQ